jgi:tellurite resistance protein
MAQSVKYLPVGLFGAVMGIEGFGLACREAPLPHLKAFGEFWVWAGIALLVVVLPAYATKLVRHPRAVRDEFTSPVQMGFCATFPLALTLCGGGLLPYSSALAQGLWWTGTSLLVGYQVWALSRWLSGGIELGQVNAAWMIIMIGGIVVPGTGVALGNPAASRFLFGVSAAATPFLMGLVFYRTVVGPPLAEVLRPTWFIFLVPPSLIYANGYLLHADVASVFLNGAFYAGLLLAPALIIAARGFLRWPFGVTWWAFTFPLDALASAASRYARLNPSPLWNGVFLLVLAAALFFILVAGAKTVGAYSRGALLVPSPLAARPAP